MLGAISVAQASGAISRSNLQVISQTEGADELLSPQNPGILASTSDEKEQRYSDFGGVRPGSRSRIRESPAVAGNNSTCGKCCRQNRPINELALCVTLLFLSELFMSLLRPLFPSCASRLSLHLRSVTPITNRLSFSTSSPVMATEFKLKDLTSVDLKNGQKQEVEVDGIEGGKVLLVKHDGNVHALNANCTHYGAPLAKGVLTADGRLTCPWHGACFSVTTGDVEDAPALDPLSKFDVIVKDGGVYIKGQEEQIKKGRRGLSIKCKKETPEKVVIVGRGSGALGAIEALRGGGFKGEITTIADEDHPPIDRTKLSKALITDVSKLQWRSPKFYEEGEVDLITGHVSSVNFNEKKVKTKDGKEYDYTKLILSTGGIASYLPLEGLKGDLKNVFVLRTLADAQGIMAAAGSEGGKKVVVVGTGFIGMEVANALASQKHEVSIIGMEKQPMERVMGEKVGAVFKSLVEKAGVKFYMEAGVEKGSPSASDSGKIGKVHLKDGTELEADLVIEGVGVKPSTDYLKDNSSIQLQKDGSVSTDEAFRVKGLKDVFAIGDIATYDYYGPGANGTPVRIEHWNVAQNAGRSVAQLINFPNSKPKPFIPVFWSALGSQLRYCGNTVGGYDDVIVQGNTDTSEGKQSFVAYYTRGEEVLAVASMMKVSPNAIRYLHPSILTSRAGPVYDTICRAHADWQNAEQKRHCEW
nr:apoptosis-inducing factor 1 [Quercus suber]